jgi:L-ascorbate peroxidase
LEIYATKYAKDQDVFFEDYAEAHAKLSNLGAKFDPPKVNGIRALSILRGRK